MVGLVFVSHSRALADALVGLVSQVTATDIPIAVAAGVGPARQDFGTDAVEITEAIQSVYSPDGVLVLMDLGSAILSADMALDFLPPEMKENIRFCDAPFVEGAIAAGVQVGLGSDLATICQEPQVLGSESDRLAGAALGDGRPAAPSASREDDRHRQIPGAMIHIRLPTLVVLAEPPDDLAPNDEL